MEDQSDSSILKLDKEVNFVELGSELSHWVEYVLRSFPIQYKVVKFFYYVKHNVA